MCVVQPPTACADEGMFSYVPNAAAFGDAHHSSSEIILPENDIFSMSVLAVFVCVCVCFWYKFYIFLAFRFRSLYFSLETLCPVSHHIYICAIRFYRCIVVMKQTNDDDDDGDDESDNKANKT